MGFVLCFAAAPCRHRGVRRHRCDRGHARRRPAAEVGINPIGINAPQSTDAMGALRATWVRVLALGTSSSRPGPGRWDPPRLPVSSSTRRSPSSAASGGRGRPRRPSGPTARPIRWCRRATPPTTGGSSAASAARERGRSPPGEIWNEPDEKDFWHGQVGAAQYALLLTAAHTAVHDADPSALVLAGGASTATTTLPRGLCRPAPAGPSTASRCTPTPPAPRHAARQLLPRGRRPRRALQLPRLPRGAQRPRAEQERRPPDHRDRARLVDDETRCSRGAGRQEGRRRHRGPAGRQTFPLPTAALLPVRPRRALVQPHRHGRRRRRSSTATASSVRTGRGGPRSTRLAAVGTGTSATTAAATSPHRA